MYTFHDNMDNCKIYFTVMKSIPSSCVCNSHKAKLTIEKLWRGSLTNYKKKIWIFISSYRITKTKNNKSPYNIAIQVCGVKVMANILCGWLICIIFCTSQTHKRTQAHYASHERKLIHCKIQKAQKG